MKIFIGVFFLSILLYGKGFVNENLLQGLPKGFMLGYKSYDKKTNTRFLEFIPKNEKVEDWTEMITTVIYHTNLPLTATQYIKRMEQLWRSKCKGSQSKIIANGKENGYDFSLITMYCPKSHVTKKQEFVWIKAIKGNDSFYSVQRAYTHKPTKKEIETVMKYLKRVQLCDSRLNNCPKVSN